MLAVVSILGFAVWTFVDRSSSPEALAASVVASTADDPDCRTATATFTDVSVPGYGGPAPAGWQPAQRCPSDSRLGARSPESGFAAQPAQIPGIGGIVGGLVGGGITGVMETAVETVVNRVSQNLVDAAKSMILEFLGASTRPQVTAEEFIGPHGAYHSTASMATLLLVGCVMIGVGQGLWSGEPVQAMLRLLGDIPVAVLAILGFPWVVDQLVTISDVMADWVLGNDLRTRNEILDLVVPFSGGPDGNVGYLIPRIFVYLGVALIYLELVVRNGLIYMVVALAPLSFMAITMSGAKLAARKAVEMVVAIILIKPAVFVELRVGLDLAHPGLGSPAADGDAWGEIFVGMAIVFIAAFMPWIIWRLMPLMEHAMVAQGVARAPFRAGMQAMQMVYFGSALAGRGARGGAGGGRGRVFGQQPAGAGGGGGFGPPRSLTGTGASANGPTRPMTRDSSGAGSERRGTRRAETPSSSKPPSGPDLGERSLGDPRSGGRVRRGEPPPAPPGDRRGPESPRGRS
ncbi:aminoglycoside adenyltransferase [Frankia sp. EAN1pec]|uniref:aminoglycoside adenyltransferase n=1 Tax=Parafrankia sp. (strain EAN1pec) TaxID=298653 RepID=UPI0012F8B142